VAGIRNNSEYVSEGNRCYIEATRKIKKGEEILVGYGREFWQLQKKLATTKSIRKTNKT
jgi:SET domain-containing protein